MFHIEKYKDSVAMIDENGRKIFYRDVLAVAERIADRIGSHRHIYVTASVNLGMLVYYIAFLNTGNIVQVVDQELSDEQHLNYICQYRPEYICEEVVEGVEYFDQAYGYGIRAAEGKNRKEMNGELALLLPTSGSTGDCKFVRLSKRNLVSNAKAIIEYLHITKDDRAIISLPLSYTYGLSVLHTHIMVGATLLVPYSKIYHPAFWKFFQTYHGTTFSGVPYTFELLDKLHFLDQALNVDYITQAGGRLSLRLQNRLIEYAGKNKIRCYIMYGQTEATARMAYLPPEFFITRRKLGSVGIPIPGGKIEIHSSDTGEKCPTGSEGEIIYKGDNVCLGYAWDYRDLRGGDEHQGILETGDIGYLDAEGFLYITGRKKRFVKILGKRINLDDVEKKINERFQISCAVVGNDAGICIFTECAKIEEIWEFSQQAFHIHIQNMQVEYISEIPRLESGKSDYMALYKKCKGFCLF